jgi:hypothetical protein
MENENNISNVLKKFKEAVTKPLEPCLLMTPTSKSFAKEEQNEERKWSPIPKTKLKKQTSTIKMVLKELTMQQYLDIYKKPTSPSALEAIKKLSKIAERKEKHKKKLSTMASTTVKKSKMTKTATR